MTHPLLHLIKTARERKYVLWNFIARDLKVKYRGTVFGYFWSLLEPLSLVGIYYFVFVVIAKRGGPEYPVIVILGVLPYNFMSSVIQSGAGTLVGNAALIRRVYIPREVFVLASLGSNLVVFLLSMLVVIPFLVIYDIAPGWNIALFVPAVVLLALFSLGVALICACANVLYRDVGYVLRVVLRILFYVSPVIYTIEMVPEKLRGFYLANPVSIYISMARNAMLGEPLAFGAEHALAGTALALLSFWLGSALFQRWEQKAVRFL